MIAEAYFGIRSARFSIDLRKRSLMVLIALLQWRSGDVGVILNVL